jgi:Domain of unknown function (DUF4185)
MGRFLRSAIALAVCVEAGCAAPPAPVEVPPRQSLAFFDNQSFVVGMDGAYSIPLSDGRSLWLFGDTFLGAINDTTRTIAGGVSNAGAFVSPSSASRRFADATFIGGGQAAQVIPDPTLAGDVRVWPCDGIEIDGKVWLYYVVAAATPGKSGGFQVLGEGVAAGGGVPPVFAPSPLLWTPPAPGFCTSVVAAGDWLYVFGVSPASDGSVRADVFLARAPLHGPLDSPSSYSYRTASADWSADPAKASPVTDGGAEMSVRYNAFLGGYVAFYLPPFGSTIEMRTAKDPWGPWSAPAAVGQCELPAGSSQAFCAGAKQHVELDRDGGRNVVLTYNTNFYQDSFAMLKTHPTMYWPVLLDVSLPEPP